MIDESFVPKFEVTGVGKLVVSEHFGPTFQGEGPSIGRPCYFIRLGGCNLHCTWCDTPYTWRWSSDLPHDSDTVYNPRDELKPYSTEELLEIVRGQPTKLIILTGGEPILQSLKLIPLVSHLMMEGYEIEVETNGTRIPQWDLHDPLNQLYDHIRYNVSPKLSNSKNPVTKRVNPTAMDWFVKNPKAIFKFVALSEQDIDEIDIWQYDFDIPDNRIYVMPEGKTRAAIQSHVEQLASLVLRKGWNMTTRLQVLIHGDKRGV